MLYLDHRVVSINIKLDDFDNYIRGVYGDGDIKTSHSNFHTILNSYSK